MPHRAGSGDVDVIADCNRRHQSRIAADLDAISDRCFLLLKPVIVARDRAGTDVRIPADGDIA